LARASDKVLINIHLFQGTIENHPPLKQAEVLSTSSRPELSSLKDKVAGSESELTEAVIDVLLDLYDMQTIEDLFLHEEAWNGLGKPLLEDFVFGFGGRASYQIRLSPKRLPSQQISLRAVILRTEKIDGGKWETIIDQDLLLDIGNPVIVGVPYQGRVYFMMVLIKIGSPIEIWREQKKAEIKKPVDLIEAPNPIVKIQPAYPEELRRRQISGKIGLRITIDEKGIAQRVDVVNPLHPYLNYTAVQAFRQWTFEPVHLKGKPVTAAFRCTYNFNPWLYLEEIAWSETIPVSDQFSREELLRVLDGSGGYCQKLSGAIMDFICEETIRETHYNLLKNINWMLMIVGPRHNQTIETEPGEQMKVVAAFKIMDPKKTLRNNFLCDYLIVKKAEGVEERRIILKENGRQIADRNRTLEEKRFTGLSALFAPLRVLAKDRQSRFNYRIIEEDKIHGKNACVIEALPKSLNEECIWSAKIWVDMKSFQILKCEIEGIPIDGYEDVLNDCAILNIKPIFLTTHEYRVEKNGILFPSRSKVRVAYPGIDFRGPIDKIKIIMAYDKYKFFTVDTESQIIK